MMTVLPFNLRSLLNQMEQPLKWILIFYFNTIGDFGERLDTETKMQWLYFWALRCKMG